MSRGFIHLLRTQPGFGWAVLLSLSAGLSWLFTSLLLPAAVLLACMLIAMGLSVNGVRLQLPPVLFALAQGLLGCLMAHSLQPAALAQVLSDWPLFLLATSSVIAASALLGWVLVRRQVFPGTTAVWGLAPGAASAMVLMAEAHGADVRLVAFMQYLRVALTTAVAALVLGTFSPLSPSAAPTPAPWFAIDSPSQVGATLLLAFGGALLARRLRLPAGPLVLPLVLGSLLQASGLLVIELPPWLMALAFAAIGWSIGLRFTGDILRYALRALPQVLGAIFALMAVGVVIALLLWQLAGIDLLTAYLATSPGGADSVAVIAATSAVDAGFVMAMQLGRFLMVLVFGPQVSQWVAKRAL